MSDDFSKSWRRVTKERERLERENMTPLQKAEANRGEDLVLLIFCITALTFVGYVLFDAASVDALWGAVLGLGLVIITLVLRFRRPLD